MSAIVTTVGETRYGQLWLVRVGLLMVFAAAMLGVAWWWPRRKPVATWAALAVAAVLPIPFSMLAHAAAQPSGAGTAIAFDWVHLLGASVWIGGVLALLLVLVPTLNDLTPAGRQVVLGRALPRFSTIALAAWAVMVLTGFYQGWLEVGSLRGLTQTPYGQTLLIKFAMLAPLLALAAFNLLVVTRKIRTASDEAAETGWSGNFVTAIAAEALLATLLLGVVGMLIGQPPAREVIAQEAGKVIIPLEANGQKGRLLLTPGSVGPNHYRLELGDGHDAHLRNITSTEAILRFELPAQRTGQIDVKLVPALGGAFEGHGSELSIAGDWTIETIVKQPGQPD
ncbi:MAG: copper resistance D family protein, partial [Thermomicrobiales bacterium]